MVRQVGESGNDALSAGDAPTDDSFRVDKFVATAHRISLADRALLHELTVGVFWPHRWRDLDVFISLGEGYLAVDEIGRAMGSAMCFRAEPDFAMLGMMVTAPRLQTMGTGRWLLRRVMKECPRADLRLSATRQGYRLYKEAGFVPLTTIRQHQGMTRRVQSPDPVPGVTARAMEVEDTAAIAALDTQAYGAARDRILAEMLRLSDGMVVEREGTICGFALRRRFGRGWVIGPVVAETEDIAMMLAAPLIKRSEGEFVRLDTPVESEKFNAFLSAIGMGVYDTVTEMYLGRQRRPLDGPRMFGLAAHSLG
ncbi:GNAT family N-acetyltransferase [Roseovarius atlanticus]|uniref:GNAT family N-acetyltransferase n=1 Tax=Roseovarius atlanticus TaxID=1641875 RepID=UPI001C95D16B|nr:GNAT family N-acetyltransferase [Roseovarius atlanticus]MBY5987747.1 GNAT family N-acetyltransferase [Roseovarius atlanticus]MBY6123138.1 GNAT family N-acetyltransferase [Roseovarius atlanticus]MBY6147634.1 GNAT family N-acetyltransferase [Roseovarius atlanticus]